MIYIFFLIVVLLICILVFFVKRSKVLNKYAQLNELCSLANNQLDLLLIYYKPFDNLSKKEYLEKYAELTKECHLIKNSFFLKSLYSESSIKQYVNNIAKIDTLQIEHNKINKDLEETFEQLVKSSQMVEDLLRGYIGFTSWIICLAKIKPSYEKIKSFKSILGKKYKGIAEYYKLFDAFEDLYEGLLEQKQRQQHNVKYMKSMLQQHSDFFDTIFSYPLDSQQRAAIVDLEDNELVIASAGSGKTSTIIGKANYLINILGIDPSKILLLTYTSKAATELKERINVDGVVASTFHKHARDTIGLITGSKPTVPDSNLLSQIFLYLFENSKDFQSWFIMYETSYTNLMKDPFVYKTAEEYFADFEKYGKMSPYKDKQGTTPFFKSKQEMQIFVYLVELGLDVRYEEQYEYDTSDSRHGRYRPDFTIHYTQKVVDELGREIIKNKKLYLEHFGVDARGNVPQWFGDGKEGGWAAANRKYSEDMQWKKQLHALKNTNFAYTTSANFTKGDIYAIIDRIIAKFNIPTTPLTNDEKLARLSKNLKTLKSEMQKLTTAFITLLKANELDLVDTINNIPKEDENYERNVNILTHIIEPIYSAYQKNLLDNGLNDFTDILLNASKMCEMNNPHDFEYILVDEFQDMSLDKYKYLKSLRRKGLPITKLFCVGDDWQSIYRFAGNDMTLFFDFKEYFGYTNTWKIETTHRFGEPLITKSSNFILENPNQKKKIVKSDSINNRTDIKFISYLDESEERKKLEEIVERIPRNKSISIIARYNYEIEQLYPKIKKTDDGRYLDLNIKDRVVKFMSVHGAKGLEADYVILIGCRGGIHGFPSLIEDDPILKYVLSKADDYENAEERRVFYVAITRAKECIYVMYDHEHRSSFIDEFVNHYSEQERCPRCKNGKLVAFKDGITSRGNYYSLIKCSNPYCDYFEPIFFSDEEVKIFSLDAFISKYYPVSHCQPQLELVGHKAIWRFNEVHPTLNEYIELELSPRLNSHQDIRDMVVVICQQDNIVRRFASDRNVESLPITELMNQTIMDVLNLAISNHIDAVVRYVNFNEEYRERKLSNIRFADANDNHMYLNRSHIHAYCHYRNEERDFKVERISAIRLVNWNYWITKK